MPGALSRLLFPSVSHLLLSLVSPGLEVLHSGLWQGSGAYELGDVGFNNCVEQSVSKGSRVVTSRYPTVPCFRFT